MSPETWTLRSGNDCLVVSPMGATVLDWQVCDLRAGDRAQEAAGTDTKESAKASSYRGDGLADRSGVKVYQSDYRADPDATGPGCQHVLDGYRTQDEVRQMDGFRNALLAPWSNRIRDGKYCFQGKEYDFKGETIGGELALHGLIADQVFELIEQKPDYLRAKVSVPKLPAYPFEVEIEVTYQISSSPHRLSLNMVAHNKGTGDAPITLGWHPYFLCPSGRAKNAKVTMAAESLVVTDEQLIPKRGQAAFCAQESPVVLSGREDFDCAYTSLIPKDGSAWAVVEHMNGSSTVVQMAGARQGQGLASFQVYSAQDLMNRASESIAVEPLLAMTDAFNRPECQDLITVSPGGFQEMSVCIEHHI